MAIVPKIPRGVRLKNPGNVRKGASKWLGKIETTDPAFEAFETIEHGIRALARVLLTYHRKHKLKSVGAIISRWAPPSENDSLEYIKHVSRALGVAPDEPIDLENELTLTALVAAICRHENGRRPDGADWVENAALIKSVEMALET